MHLSKKYGSKLALDKVNIQVPTGSIYGFIGENGAGKTTLMRILTGLSTQTSGTFELFGKQGKSAQSKVRMRMGTMIEGPVIYPEMSAYENLNIHRIVCGIPDTACIDEMLQFVNQTDTGKKKAKHFSMGMRQRLGIGLALLNKPGFLILDEPINGLDPSGIIEIRELLRKLNQEQGITILISSHILTELYQLATCFGFIHQGKMIEELTKVQLDEKSKKHIFLRVNDSAQAVTVLETVLGTIKYTVYPDNIIKVYDLLNETGRVSGELAKAGLIVTEISLRGDDIEGYYMRLIGVNTMLNLLKTEFMKLGKMFSFKILLLGQAILGILFLLFIIYAMNTPGTATYAAANQYTGYLIFEESLGQTQSNAVFVSIFAAMFICGEFTNRTAGLAIAAGRSRTCLFIGKIIVYFIGSIALVSVLPLVMTVSISLIRGFGVRVTGEVFLNMLSTYIVYLLVSLAICAIVAMIAYMIKNIGGSMVVCILLTLALSIVLQFAVLGGKTDSVWIKLAQFSPFYQANLLKFSMTGAQRFMGVLTAVTHTVAAMVAGCVVFNKSELK